MLSFYSFFTISNTKEIIERAKMELMPHEDIKGTLYVAEEGVNGQFSVPTSKLALFGKVMKTLDPQERMHNIDYNIGECLSAEAARLNPPFRKLLIRQRDKILRDGLPEDDAQIDWSNTGPELTPEQWHREVTSEEGDILLLDCRNAYESEHGTFNNATPLKTEVFSDSWEKLDDILGSVDKNKRILTFCTGGIRCVKVNAYLKQKLGFNNVGRLEKGIIGYKTWLARGEDSAFEGENYVFDRRRIISIDEHKK